MNKTADIRALTPDDFPSAHAVITAAFATVAKDFGLTRENAASNAAFLTLETMLSWDLGKLTCFGLFDHGRMAGFVAVESAGDGKFYLEKLAVVPDFRHSGFGRFLLEHACGVISAKGGTSAGIGIINENVRLKDWYSGLGFVETGLRRFDDLPFTVCFMKKELL
jgi:ribosomal protein S18 acetylase RimI-like enzyme